MKFTFLRTNFFWYEQQSGGSVSHIAGFAQGLHELGHDVDFISTDRLQKIDEALMPVRVIPPKAWQKRLPYVGEFFYNFVMIPQTRTLLKDNRPDVLYQRHSMLNFTGAVVSRQLNLPFVLEYNSPEGWKLRYWTKTTPLKQRITNIVAWVTERCERFSLKRAALIVVVSQALKDRLIAQGVPADKILMNPNGVDLQAFDAAPSIKQKRGIIPIGFVGTFAHWHGAEVLCRAVKTVVTKEPKAHFLMIGDGAFRKECEAIIAADGMQTNVSFLGTVNHTETIGILKTCTVLVSPHVPNPDGTPFFGSPTKLFEYMAAGKCIVASDLFQVGDIIREHAAGITVPPGDAKALARGILKALANPKLCKELGAHARTAAEQTYTWKANAARVVAALPTSVMKS